MSKHTPGPWILNLSSIDGISQELGNIQICLLSTTRWSYPDQGKNKMLEKESGANARLIASAPDLLEMLKKAQARLFMSQGNDEMYFEIGKVIDKAEGNE